MKARQVLSILFILVLFLGIGGCGSSGSGSSDSSSDSPDSSSSSDSSSASDTSGTTSYSPPDESLYAASVAGSSATYNSEDMVGTIIFDYTIVIDFTSNTARLSSGEAQTITTDGVTLVSADSTSVTVKKTDYGITISSTLTSNVKYDLSGDLGGTLTVSSSSPYQLCLNGVDITGSAGPALDLESSQKVYIVSASGTTNTLRDSSTRSMTMKAALYGKGPMVFSGDGSLGVTGSYKHGIFSNDYIRVCGGTLHVAVSARDAVRSVNGFIFDDGDLTISATGTTTDDESKGIKVEGVEGDGAGKGYIVINGGYITVTSVGKAITAAWDIDEDATTSDTSDDPDPYVEVNNGVITLTTTGTPYEYVQNGTTISCSPEGIEGKTDLTINSGYLSINTTDDCLNSGESMSINGGYVYCASTKNDAVDTNGSLNITGGFLVAIGSSAPEGPFDCDMNAFAITGGTVVGIGGTTSRLTESACTQNVVILGGSAKGSTMALMASDGTVAFAYTVPKTCATVIISSPDIASTTEYTVYTGGTASGDDVFNGLYLGSMSYSGGSSTASLTTSSRITKIGGQYF